jgi:acyl-CoA synthetase (AMP-forming)/AMP-acid ligase II
MPTEIEIRSSLPKTTVGKLSKKELLAEDRQTTSDGHADRKPDRSRVNNFKIERG